MAELAISAALAIAAELVSHMILKVNKDVEKEVRSMQTWLPTLKTFIEHNRRFQDKVERARNIAFEIEDVLDEIVLHSNYVYHRDIVSQKTHKVLHNIKHWFPHDRILEKITSIKADIEDIKSQIALLADGCSNSSSTPSSCSAIGHRVSPLLLDDEMIGYEDLKERFVGQLMGGGGEGLVTLAVVGPAGSGKTTFVKNVFWKPRIRGRFDCHAWVHVPKAFDDRAVFVSMLKQFQNSRLKALGQESYDAVETSAKLRAYLERRRYVIVLDDIWREEHWDLIKDALPNGRRGSRIIVSTRSSNIALSCASSDQFKYDVKGLIVSDAWRLFCKIAFKDNNGECPVELKDHSSRIVARCEGLPFAIVAVGRALARKPKLPVEWERFHEGLGRDTSAIDNTLLPGYIDLSSNLKSCFLYFGLFPEDYSVGRSRLLRLWLAERFVTPTDSKTEEEVAEDYLNELIHRNLVHVSRWDFDGRPRSCRVLSPVLTFIVQKCKEEIFASIFPRENTSATSKIRRLTVFGDCSHLPQSSEFAVIRSAFLFRCASFSTDQFGDNFLSFKLLRVLDLQDAPLTKFPENITSLFLLRYLSLSGTNIKKIPNSIKKLYYLRTLDLRQTQVTQLPKAILRLHNLLHLFAYRYNVDTFVAFDSVRGVEIPRGIGSLTNLQKLYLVKVDQKGRIIKELNKLIQLRKLGLTGIRREHSKDLCKSLEQLTKLTTLDLCANTEEEFLEVGEIQNPSRYIQRLYLKGRLNECPRWIARLDNLLRIGLKWSKLKDSPLKALGHLPNLIEIQLVDSYDGDQLEFEASTFKKLKILEIESFLRLNTIVIEEGAVPGLQRMNLRQCPNLKMLPLGINTLSKIEELVLHDMPEEFVAVLRKQSEDRMVVQHVPVIHSFTLSNQGWSLENLSGASLA